MTVFHELLLPLPGDNAEPVSSGAHGVVLVSRVSESEVIRLNFLEDVGDFDLGRSLSLQRRKLWDGERGA